MSNHVWAFESGIYHGESADHQQVCDLNIVQKEDSVLLQKFDCKNSRLGLEYVYDRYEVEFGHLEINASEDDIEMERDVSADLIKTVIRSTINSDMSSDELSVSDEGKIHYRFTEMSDNSESIIFDIELFPQQ